LVSATMDTTASHPDTMTTQPMSFTRVTLACYAPDRRTG